MSSELAIRGPFLSLECHLPLGCIAWRALLRSAVYLPTGAFGAVLGAALSPRAML